ncbi:MAPEG family protein [Luteimonas abyssi]|uniref:MAPEG family protein n=1 Tax=Luteimonas abyssi TaxID=1247514 RepID=UPI000737C804|nr:MAPEG family protein [Luteimonas abyssi]
MELLPVELRMLAWSVVLGFVQLALAAAAMTHVRGLAWNAGARDGQAKPLEGIAGRLERALRNFLETFPFFAAAVLAVLWAERADATSALGAQLYLWARVAYVPLYALGVPYVRSLVWVVSVVGLLMVLGRLF